MTTTCNILLATKIAHRLHKSIIQDDPAQLPTAWIDEMLTDQRFQRYVIKNECAKLLTFIVMRGYSFDQKMKQIAVRAACKSRNLKFIRSFFGLFPEYNTKMLYRAAIFFVNDVLLYYLACESPIAELAQNDNNALMIEFIAEKTASPTPYIRMMFTTAFNPCVHNYYALRKAIDNYNFPMFDYIVTHKCAQPNYKENYFLRCVMSMAVITTSVANKAYSKFLRTLLAHKCVRESIRSQGFLARIYLHMTPADKKFARAFYNF
jgi:hypothetical protein